VSPKDSRPVLLRTSYSTCSPQACGTDSHSACDPVGQVSQRCVYKDAAQPLAKSWAGGRISKTAVVLFTRTNGNGFSERKHQKSFKQWRLMNCTCTIQDGFQEEVV
jgi:hypothetical protein